MIWVAFKIRYTRGAIINRIRYYRVLLHHYYFISNIKLFDLMRMKRRKNTIFGTHRLRTVPRLVHHL